MNLRIDQTEHAQGLQRIMVYQEKGSPQSKRQILKLKTI